MEECSYQKPRFHFVPYINNLTNREIASKSETELVELINKTKHSDNAKLYKINDDYLLREIGDEAVLVPVGSGSEQMNGMIVLNETFQFVWKQFQKPYTIYDVILEAKLNYEDEDGKIEKDIRRLVNESLKFGLLKEEK